MLGEFVAAMFFAVMLSIFYAMKQLWQMLTKED